VALVVVDKTVTAVVLAVLVVAAVPLNPVELALLVKVMEAVHSWVVVTTAPVVVALAQ
jgi:hypothetical protein